MNADYVRQVAAECDELTEKFADERFSPAGLHVMRALTRAAAVLHMAVLPSESHGERANGSRSVSETGETPTGQQRTAEDETVKRLTGSLDLLRVERNIYRKRWHEAATQRDALVAAAREALDNPRDQFGERDGLRAAVEQVESGGATTGTTPNLRRELWHVLDRMPASDDDLIATVKQLLNDRDLLGKSREHVERERDQARSQRDRLLRATRAIQRAHDLTKADDVVVELENTIVRIEHELGL